MNSSYFARQKKNRSSLIFVFFMGVYCLIIARFYVVQVHKSDFYKQLGYGQYYGELELMPPRGLIYERGGKLLALNKEVESAFIVPNIIKDKSRLSAFLQIHYPQAYARLKEHPDKKFLWVKRNVTLQEKQALSKACGNDVIFISEMARFYPYPQASSIVGITDVDSKGIAGIEQTCNKVLAGSPSRVKVQKDARSGSLYFDSRVLSSGTQGDPVRLTLDIELQNIAADEVQKAVERYEAVHGASIVLDPATGDILAMAQYPFYNPQADEKVGLEALKSSPLSDCYEFGSVIKAFTMLAALSEKVTTSDEQFDCGGKTQWFGKFRVQNWKPLGILSFSDSFRYSSNVALARVALRLGPKLYDNFIKLGFGRPTGLEVVGERSGFLAPPSKWSKSTNIVLSFGYEMNATLLQLAQAFSVIANDGKYTPIHITHEKRGEEEELYAQDVVAQTKEILENSATTEKISGFRVMGKTGTARIVENGKYSDSRHIYTFGGIVEKGNYKRVIITFIKEPKEKRGVNLWASQVSAPLFKSIAQRIIVHDTLSGLVT